MNLLDQPRLFINQKAKLIELVGEYRIRDENGIDLGYIRQEGQSALKKVARFSSSLDMFMTHKLVIYDSAGTPLLELTRPRAFLFSKINVADGNGRPVGSLVQARKVFAKVRFGLEDPQGMAIGEIRAENWRAWDFHIADPTGREIGRITKKWAGTAKEIFTTADNYMIEIDPSVTGDLRLLLVAAAAGIDLAVKQHSN